MADFTPPQRSSYQAGFNIAELLAAMLSLPQALPLAGKYLNL